MTTIVVAMGQERFGTVEKLKKHQPNTETRRAKEVKPIRLELKVLTKDYKQANDAEKQGLAELRQVLRITPEKQERESQQNSCFNIESLWFY